MVMDVDKGRIILTLILAVFWILIMGAIAATAGCGSVSIEKHSDGSYKATTRSLFKDIKDVNIEKTAEGDVNAAMGSSTSTEGASALFLVCTINPDLPICQQDP